MLVCDQTLLLVVDFQENLLPKIAGADSVVSQSLKLIRFAQVLNLPILLTEQYPKGLGRTVAPVMEALGPITPIEKLSFGCFGSEEFAGRVRASERMQLLVTGIETHVCVMQTVLAGRSLGYEVFVPTDATGSRAESERNAGLVRMQAAGAELVTVEMALFELLRAAGTPEFKKVLPLLK